jgi:hypothetical protein
MTVTPGPDQPPEPPLRPTDDQDAVTYETADPEPLPTEAPHADGPEVEVETTTAAAAHTVASPSPIHNYTWEPSVEAPGAAPAPAAAPTAAPAPAPAADAPNPFDTAPTRQYPADAGLTVPPTLGPTHPFPPEPPSPAPEPQYRAPEPPSPAPEPVDVPATVRTRRRPLFGTIIWGVILLALAGYVLLGVLVPAPADPTLWLLGGVVVIGLLLIIVGVIAALRRAG